MKPKSNVNQPAKDLCYTPNYATKALCEFLNTEGYLYLDAPVTDYYEVFEPACGDHHMIPVLEHYFSDVFPSDVQQGLDFLEWETIQDDGKPQCIITNPPYTAKAKYGFIDKCVELGKDFALLMPVETMAAKKAQQAFEKVGGVSMLMFDTRVDFLLPEIGFDGNGAQFPVAWFISGFGLERNKMYFTSIAEEKKAFKKALKEVA